MPARELADEAQEPFEKRLYQLLQRPTTGKWQYRGRDNQVGYGRHVRIGLSDFKKHLCDGHPLAISCVKSLDAIFLAWDIDARFNERLSIFAAVLAKRGYSRGAFAISGSAPGRGKIVLTLGSPIPKAQAVAIARDIVKEARYDLLFGNVNGDVTMFPNNGTAAGNTVRLFGKNLKRPDHTMDETALDINGVPSDLWNIVPARIEKSTIYSRDMMVLSTEKYTGNGATIAGDALGAAWRCSSREDFEQWCDNMLRQDGLTGGTRQQLQRADFRNRTWAKRGIGPAVGMAAPRTLWRPRTVPTGMSAKPAWRVYTAGSALAVRIGRNPHCFSITYGQWADEAGYVSKTACSKAATEAEKAGLLVRVERGDARPGGLSTLVAFVGEGETLQAVFENAKASDEYRQRLRIRNARGEPLYGNIVVDGCVVYPPRLNETDATDRAA